MLLRRFTTLSVVQALVGVIVLAVCFLWASCLLNGDMASRPRPGFVVPRASGFSPAAAEMDRLGFCVPGPLDEVKPARFAPWAKVVGGILRPCPPGGRFC